MPFPSPFNRQRAYVFTGIIAGLMVAACSKQAQPAADAVAKPASTTPPAPATDEQRLISQARAAIGPEAKLEAVNGVFMSGKIFDGKNNALGTLVLLYQKAAKAHIEQRLADKTIIQGSDGMIGWVMQVDKNNNKRVAVLKAPDEALNIYMAMENMYFYRAADHVQGSVVRDEGEVDYRGAKCHKLSFQYPNNITFVRYLDITSGKLRGTVQLPSGAEVVEDGTMDVNGVAFPAVVSSYDKTGKLTQVVKFDKIGLNPAIDPKTKPFDLPDMVALAKAAATKPAASIGSASGKALPNQTKPAGTSAGFPSPDSLIKKN